MEDNNVEDTATVYDCDNMSPDDFEIFMKKVYEKIGYENVVRTPHTGDHGADLVMEKSSGEKIVVQTKRWKARITNDSVQEVLGAMAWYDAQNGIVVGTTGFTNSARQEAEKSGIELIDRDVLEKLLEDYPTSLPKVKSISDITIEDIYEEKTDYLEIVREMMRFVLKNIDNANWRMYSQSGQVIQQKIRVELQKKLISPSDQTKIVDKVIEFLKNDEYRIDLTKSDWNMDAPPEVGMGVIENDVKVFREREQKEHGRLVTLMDTMKELEGEEKYPVLAQILIDKLVKSGKFATEKEVTKMVRKLTYNAAIYECKPGYFNTV